MGKIKDNWQIVVFTAVLSLVTSGVLLLVTNRESKLAGAASYDYVDQKHLDQKIYIDEKAHGIESRVEAVEKRVDAKAEKEYVERIDDKLDKIYELLLQERLKQ